MTVGERIRAIRQKRKITQKQLGEQAGIAEPTIRRYELGKLNPKYETLEKIANALGVQVWFLQNDVSDEALQIEIALNQHDYDVIEKLLQIPEEDITPEFAESLRKRITTEDQDSHDQGILFDMYFMEIKCTVMKAFPNLTPEQVERINNLLTLLSYMSDNAQDQTVQAAFQILQEEKIRKQNSPEE